jgi:hypothetical protein
VGSLLAPTAAVRLERLCPNPAMAWLLAAVAMLAGWSVAPLSPASFCLAVFLAGLSMTTLEGMLDTAAARRQPTGVTGALARATAARALGSAAATAVLPVALRSGTLPVLAGVGVVALLCGVLTVSVLTRLEHRWALGLAVGVRPQLLRR